MNFIYAGWNEGLFYVLIFDVDFASRVPFLLSNPMLVSASQSLKTFILKLWIN